MRTQGMGKIRAQRKGDLPQVTARQGRAHTRAWGAWYLSLHPSYPPEVAQ